MKWKRVLKRREKHFLKSEKLVRCNVTFCSPCFCVKKRCRRLEACFSLFFHFLFTGKSDVFHWFFTNVFTCLFSGPFLPLHACLSMSVSICLYLSLLVSACLWSPFPSLSVCMSGVGCLCLPVCLPVSLSGLCLHVPILVMFAFSFWGRADLIPELSVPAGLMC